MRTAILVGATVLVFGASTHAQQIIAQAGNQIPGGGKIRSISRAVISSEGLVAFVAGTDQPREVVALIGRPGKPGAPFVWQRALVADVPPPGAPADAKLLLTPTTNLSIAPNGWLIAQTPVHLNRPGFSRVNALMLSDGQQIQTAAMEDYPMPKPLDGMLHGPYRPEMNGNYIAYGTQGRKGEGTPSEEKRDFIVVVNAGQTWSVVAAQGDAVQGANGTLDLGGIALKRVAVTEAGQVYFADAIEPRRNAILTSQPGKPAQVVLSAGTAAPLPNRRFAGFSQLSAAGGALAFHAVLDSTTPRDYSKVHGCFYRDAQGKVQLIVKGGDPLPGHAPLAVDHHQPLFDPIVSRSGRFILVQTLLTRPAPNKHGEKAVLLFDTQTGKLETVVHKAMTAPMPDEPVTFDRFGDVMFNSSGQVAFKNGDAVWAGKPGQLRRVVSKGEAVQVGDRTLHPRDIALTGEGRAGDGNALNDAGQLLVQLTDQGAGSVLVLFNVE